MKNESNISLGGLLNTLLLVAFIVLKLCHIIEWSWWWVLAPLWIPFAISIVCIIIGIIVKLFQNQI